MAREELQREDILAEATALVARAEFVLDDHSEPVVGGFRRDGAASFYFGDDVAYHFNSSAELRRAYCDGLLYKAEQGNLVALRRSRTDAATELVRHELDAADTSRFLDQMMDQLRHFQQALAARRYRLVGQVPSAGDVSSRLQAFLERLPPRATIAPSPHAR